MFSAACPLVHRIEPFTSYRFSCVPLHRLAAPRLVLLQVTHASSRHHDDARGASPFLLLPRSGSGGEQKRLPTGQGSTDGDEGGGGGVAQRVLAAQERAEWGVERVCA